ncbi:MAG: hypothetical protein RBQ84_12240, partial [Arcobacter sp.]
MIKKIVTTLKNVPNFSFMKKDKKKKANKKDFLNEINFKSFFEKQKKSIYDFIGKSDDPDTHLSNVIEDMIKDKFHLKGGYGDLIANEEKYEQFVRTLGYEYYATYNELSKYYQDT